MILIVFIAKSNQMTCFSSHIFILIESVFWGFFSICFEMLTNLIGPTPKSSIFFLGTKFRLFTTKKEDSNLTPSIEAKSEQCKLYKLISNIVNDLLDVGAHM